MTKEQKKADFGCMRFIEKANLLVLLLLFNPVLVFVFWEMARDFVLSFTVFDYQTLLIR